MSHEVLIAKVLTSKLSVTIEFCFYASFNSFSFVHAALMLEHLTN